MVLMGDVKGGDLTHELYYSNIGKSFKNLTFMNTKQLRITKYIVFVLMAGLAVYATTTNHYTLLLFGFIIAAILLVTLRRRVTEVLADERDKHVAGQAALAAMYVFCWLAGILALASFAMRGVNQTYETIALTLAYSACLVLITYSLAFRFYDRFVMLKRKGLLFALGFIVLAIVAIGGLRALSPEDDWLCQDGQWVKHGQPEMPMPTTPCEK